MQDPVWFRTLLTLHIAAGFASFLIAPVALFTAKGGKAHRLWGKFYFWAMSVVAGSALILALFRPVLFLALVAVFSFYNSFAGYRVLKMKKLASQPQQVLRIDWAVGGTTFLASLALAVFAICRPAWVQNMTIPGVIFGFLGMGISGQTLSGFVNPARDKMFWWYGHVRGMIGSYIAAWTAFCVVTLGPLVPNSWVVWVLPTAIGVPAIALTIAHYQRKFNANRRLVAVGG